MVNGISANCIVAGSRDIGGISDLPRKIGLAVCRHHKGDQRPAGRGRFSWCSSRKHSTTRPQPGLGISYFRGRHRMVIIGPSNPVFGSSEIASDRRLVRFRGYLLVGGSFCAFGYTNSVEESEHAGARTPPVNSTGFQCDLLPWSSHSYLSILIHSRICSSALFILRRRAVGNSR